MKNFIQYTEASLDDIPEIVNLFKTTILHVNAQDYSTNELRAWAKGSENIGNWINRVSTHYFLLARLNQKLVGMASLDLDGYLDVIYVHREHQRNRIASTLLSSMEKKTRNLGHSRIYSDVSITAKPFFIHQGYNVVSPQLVLCRGVYLRNYHVEKILD